MSGDGLGLVIVLGGVAIGALSAAVLLVIARALTKTTPPRPTSNDPGPDAEPERHPGNPEETP